MTRKTATMERVKQYRADARRKEAELKLQARLEQITVYKITRTRKSKNHDYWYSSWKEGEKSHSVYLGSCKKMTIEEAEQKAHRMKAAALALKQ